MAPILRIFFFAFIFVAAGQNAEALTAYPDWVETNVSLRPDGKAQILYRIKYRIDSGAMRAFYFMGTAAKPHFDLANCFAESDKGHRYQLDISHLGGGKYDVVLGKGARYGPGHLIFTLRYAADLAGSGHLAKTRSPEFGDLVVFHWAPVQWDSPLSHQTVMVHYPIRTNGKKVTKEFLDDVVFKTEPFMNANYLMDYYGQEYGGEHWFTVRIHKEDLGSREHMRIQQYISHQKFPMTGVKAKKVARQSSRPVKTAPPKKQGWMEKTFHNYPELAAIVLLLLLSPLLPFKTPPICEEIPDSGGSLMAG